MDEIPDLELVKCAFPAVSVIVTNIALRRRHGQLGELGAHLCSFALEIQELTSQQTLTWEQHVTLHDILTEVENVISVPLSGADGYYPTLQAIAQSEHTSQDENTGNRSIRKGLERLIRHKITERTHAGCDFGPSVAVMQARSRIYEYRSLDIMEGIPPSETPPDYSNQIQALYNVLQTHSACSCILQPSSKHHLAKLRLSPYSGLQDGEQVKLEMLFSSSPDPMYSGQYGWQEAQIEVPRLDLSHRTVRFAEDNTGQSGSCKNSILVRRGEFCELISKRCGSCLHLTVSSGQLYILLDSNGREQQVEPIAGLPLGQVLDKFGLHFGMRPVLGYILARSVWQYYASDWMNSAWTSQTVYFMAERAGGQTTAYFCKPYQLIKFGASRQNAVEYQPVIGMMHRYPRVLALGIMLVELATGRSILTADMNIQQCDARTTNIQLCSIREILNSAAFEDDCTFPQYQTVIQKCLDPGLFKNASASPTDPRENLEQRRDILYEEVVHPLKLLVEGTGWNTEFHKLEDTPLTPKGRKPSNEQSRSFTGQIRTLSGLGANRDMSIAGNSHICSNATLDNQAQSTRGPATLDDYTIGWICALKVEFVAAVELLDVKCSAPSGIPCSDDNLYTCGQMRDHNVVIACLPKGEYGVTAAASVAKDMMRSFTNVHTILMVGIGGGAPSRGRDIKLGDVVVGVPTKQLGGVIHYEFGRATQDHGFQRTGHLNSTPTRLLSALQYIETIHTTCGNQITSTVDQMIGNNPMLRYYTKPDPQTDVLFKSSFVHPYNSQDCMQSCIMQTDQIVRQGNPDEAKDGPVIHYGLIASADRLMKDANIRDHLAETEGVLCFEMEAAGLMNRCPCVVIRGICDYSDTHKNDRWQGYAAATAAAFAKELLGVVRAY